jgi:hypothetical protein
MSVCVREVNIPRIGSGGPAGTADQTERERNEFLLKEVAERRARDRASMAGYRMYKSSKNATVLVQSHELLNMLPLPNSRRYRGTKSSPAV